MLADHAPAAHHSTLHVLSYYFHNHKKSPRTMALCPRSASIAILCSTALVAAIFYAYNNNNNESILNDPNKRWLAAVSSFTDPRKVTPRFRNPVRKHLPIEQIPALLPDIVYEGHAQTIGLEQKLDTFFANHREKGASSLNQVHTMVSITPTPFG